MVDLAFGIFGAAMFAEPAVTKVEEVVGLVHGRKKGVGCQGKVSGARCRVSVFHTRHLTPDTRHPFLLPASSIRCFCQTHWHRHPAAIA
jgi:hypothetical protein